MLAVLTLLASCATPMLPGVLRAIAHYQFDDPTLSAGFINEFRPIYAGPIGLISLGLVVGQIAVASVKKRSVRRSEWLLLCIAILPMFRLGRFAPIYAIVAAPVVSVTLPRMSVSRV